MAEEKNVADSSPIRVKVYYLSDANTWDTRGTGHCTYLPGEGGEADEIIVDSDEEENVVLLKSKIMKEYLFTRPQDTLIVWSQEVDSEYALSFLNVESCDKIWSRICAHVNPNAGDNDGDLGKPSEMVGLGLDDESSDMSQPYQDSMDALILPPPKASNLSTILKILKDARTITEKDQLATFIVVENYTEKLSRKFELFEQHHNIKGLHSLYTIMRGIISLNDNTIIENLVRDENVLGAMGILEYDPSTPNMKAKHRQFITKNNDTEMVVPVDDSMILTKIHLSARLQYLKDVVLANYLDEALTAILHSLIFFNNVDIVNYFQNNGEYLTELFGILKDDTSSVEKKREVVRFLYQLCSLGKSLQAQSRAEMYRTLVKYDLLDAIVFGMKDEEGNMRSRCVDILLSMVEVDASLIRTHIMQEATDEGRSDRLLDTVMHYFVTDKEHFHKSEYAEMLKLLLDSNSGSMIGATAMAIKALREDNSEIEDFLILFYDNYAHSLLKPLQALDTKVINLNGPVEALVLPPEQTSLCLQICELLCFAVRNHGFRSKYLILSTNCLSKIIQLYRCRETHMKLAALRLVRTCVGTMDDFYIRFMIKNNLFEPTIRVLLDTDGQNNLLNSACLELFEFIRKENVKTLVDHLITKYGSVLDTTTYISTCSQLRLRYEQNKDTAEKNTPNQEDGSSRFVFQLSSV
ncbi:component of IIS longevity pathway SMK-1-domain-containing protein [Radiomyces spectabilis]|uniref:component of IIS longevity pathway SMK-1-domain-containing protein n=1 Tax=Radiomyces spectabilis TaxID=64574 RepID=UPI0022210BE7|nr:component of IIS longevity pathway SMK-1-domain-containing protein [Radiomyces spectabilis]KAI8380880.1 component of IIS longevity pathway SMK-1-domain-containing protein [Radiomyces spectabilis]